MTTQRWCDHRADSLYQIRQSMYKSEFFAKLEGRTAGVLFDKMAEM